MDNKKKDLTNVRRYASTALTWLNRAKKYYAYYKNANHGDLEENRKKSQSAYIKARNLYEKTTAEMKNKGIVDNDVTEKLNLIKNELDKKIIRKNIIFLEFKMN